MGLDEVHAALRRLTAALEEDGIPYAIDVLIAGDYRGDDKPKAVRFPNPSVGIPGEGFRVLPLRDLVELELAPGITNPDRLKDLADVQELVRHAGLPRELGAQLDPMVRAKYDEIWSATARHRDDEY